MGVAKTIIGVKKVSQEETQTPLEGVKMYVAQVFYGLDTAPEGAVVVYKAEIDEDSLPGLQDFYIATLDDGNIEVAWGVGVTLEDALEVASREWDYLYEGSPVRVNNPFREILGEDQKDDEQ